MHEDYRRRYNHAKWRSGKKQIEFHKSGRFGENSSTIRHFPKIIGYLGAKH